MLVTKFLGPEWKIESDALAALNRFRWPGNVRQLINAIDRAKILADPPTIRLADLPAEIAHGNPSKTDGDGAVEVDEDSLAAIQRAHVVEVLTRERGNKARAARALGVNRRSLYRLLEKYKID